MVLGVARQRERRARRERRVGVLAGSRDRAAGLVRLVDHPAAGQCAAILPVVNAVAA